MARERRTNVVNELRRGEQCIWCDDFLSVHPAEDGGDEAKLLDKQPVVVDEHHVPNVVPAGQRQARDMNESAHERAIELSESGQHSRVCGEDEDETLEQGLRGRRDGRAR